MENLPVEGFDQLDTLVEKSINRFNGVGMNIALITNAEINAIKSYGFFEKEHKIPMHKDAVFQLASISKPIAAWGVMKLVEKGYWVACTANTRTKMERISGFIVTPIKIE